MEIKAYKNYGVLAHEKAPTYTVGMPDSTAVLSEEVVINIPEGFSVSENAAGEKLIDTPDGITYLVSEMISQQNGEPALSWYDGKRHWVKCTYQEV